MLRQFNRLCRQENLFGGELLAIDGTKVKAVNAADQNWTQTKLEKQAARLETRLGEYLAAWIRPTATKPRARSPRPRPRSSRKRSPACARARPK